LIFFILKNEFDYYFNFGANIDNIFNTVKFYYNFFFVKFNNYLKLTILVVDYQIFTTIARL